MTKFGANVVIAIKDLIAYKFEMLIWGILNPLLLAIYYFLWKAIYAYSGQAALRGFSLDQLVVYYALMLMLSSFTWTNVDLDLANRIRDGFLSTKLVRPVEFFEERLYRKVGEVSLVIFGQILPTAIIAVLFFGLHITSYINFAFFIISAVLAMLLNYVLIFFMGISGFWLEKYSGMRMFRSGLMWFLSGAFVPISFFPLAVQNAFKFLPFQHTMFTPIQIFLGKYNLQGILLNLAVQAVWIAVFYVLVKSAWRVGLKRFQAVGQ